MRVGTDSSQTARKIEQFARRPFTKLYKAQVFWADGRHSREREEGRGDPYATPPAQGKVAREPITQSGSPRPEPGATRSRGGPG
jgi:hypothetical protein